MDAASRSRQRYATAEIRNFAAPPLTLGELGVDQTDNVPAPPHPTPLMVLNAIVAKPGLSYLKS
jgi:hypothetical protein